MTSTVGLELTNFLSPELTWKKVTKGNRSGARRTRKPVARKSTIGLKISAGNDRPLEDATVSDSEKLGVAVLGRRFSDKIEHVPIKKRRFVFRSPSPPPPPQTPSPHLEVSEQHVGVQAALGQSSCSNSTWRQQLMGTGTSTRMSADADVFGGKFSGEINENLGFVEDFSGIEILADVACNDSMNDGVDDYEAKPSVEEELKQERIDSSASAMPLEDTIASLETDFSSPEDKVNEVKDLSIEDKPTAILHDSPGDKDKRTAEMSISLPDDRSLWDLNLSMDAWERPSDDGHVGSEQKAINNEDKCELLQAMESQDIKNDSMDKLISCDEDKDSHMSSDSRTLPLGTASLKGEPGLEGFSGPSTDNSKCVSVPAVNAEEPLTNIAADGNASSKIASVDQRHNDCPLPESDGIASTLLSKDIREALLSGGNLELSTRNCATGAESGKTICVENVQVEDSDVASPYVPVLEKVRNEIEHQMIEDEKDCGGNPGIHVATVSSQEDDSQLLENVSLEVNPASKVEKMDICNPSPNCKDTTTSSGSVVADGAECQMDSSPHMGSEEVFQKSSGNCTTKSVETGFITHGRCGIDQNGSTCNSDKVDMSEPCDESHDSAASKGKVAGIEKSLEPEAGYDSQFEDGELRESDALLWEETEQLDYDTEGEEERLCGLEAECSEKKLRSERGSSPGHDDITVITKHCDTQDGWIENSVSPQMRVLEGTDGCEIKRPSTECVDASDVKGSHSRVDGSKTSKRELVSHDEVSPSLNVVQRSRSDNFDVSYHQPEREAGSDKFVGRDRSASRMRGRSPESGHFFNPSASFWDSKRQHSPIYHQGPYNSARSRPKSVIESRGYVMSTDQALPEAAGVARADNRTGRHFMSSTSNGVYRPLMRRRSPVERDESYGMHARMAPVRDVSPDRNRFRRYSQGVGRGIRDEYLRHIPDDSTEYFSRMPHRLGRRERSISPHGHYTEPYKKTRSRSRSRSPSAWLLPRERNEFSRRRSRSPDFRSDARVERVRLPFPKRLAGDYGEGFMSPPRSRISPQRNSRLFEDRNAGLDHFRGRKSPVRMFRQNQRFDSSRPIRRLNSDDYFRQVIRPKRYTDMGVGNKGYKYEGSDDDKHGGRYEMIHRVRRYDTDGAVRRFRYNPEDSYVANNS